ncbi:hypothetical protein [Streptomyces tailanensis]|uniref:hypothetical protein n=1 Tax=Streptomyces tailanensis TaxID=2569858 RepID=UPI00122E1853|nr:hypothetical protein [Streptomyces tailanensis]
MPRRIGWRGAGLGNEIFPWAKAYLASRELGFRLARPAWGLNRRDYRHEFGTSRLDWVGHAALRMAMPVVTVTDEMVRSTGETDYGTAMRLLDTEYRWSQRRSLILLHQGMSGGHLGIERARNYLRNELLGHLPEDGCPEDWGPDAGQLRVAVHIRLGDFSQHSTGPKPGVFNRRLPFAWYRWVLDTLQGHFGEMLHVDLVSDDPIKATRMLPEWSGCTARSRTILEDLSIMATADLLVCSVSTFSMLAAFLSDAPYVWYRPHLHEQGGFLSIWGYPPEQQGRTRADIRREQQIGGPLPARGVAVDVDGELPSWLTGFLMTKAALNRRSADLVHCGVVPERDPLLTVD